MTTISGDDIQATISTDVVTKVVIAFAYTAVRPTRFFTDETEATRWLLTPHPDTETGTEPEAAQELQRHSGHTV